MTKSPGTGAICTGVASTIAALFFTLPQTGLAQDATGGNWLDFGFDQTLELDIDGSDIQSSTDLSFGYRSETRHSEFAATATISARSSDLFGGDTLVTDPRFGLRYAQTAASSSISAFARYTRGDISFIDPLTDFLDDDGNIVITPDFIDLSGAGIRTDLSYGVTLTLFDDHPFGLTLDANVGDLSYTDTTTTALVDSTRTTLAATGRFDITPVMQATLGLTAIQLESAGSRSETTTLDTNVQITRPRGALGFGASLVDTAEGTRATLRFSGSYAVSELANVSGEFGITRSADGDDVFTTGSLSYSQTLAQGQISARLNRSVGTNSDNAEEVQTSLSLGASRQLTPLTTLSLDAAYAQTEETVSGESSALSSVGATLNYDLTPDWSLSTGVSYRTSDVTGVGTSQGTNLSLSLSRDFSYRP